MAKEREPGIVGRKITIILIDPGRPIFNLYPAATNRLVAVELLFSRCSSFIRRREIAADVEALLATTPQKN
jgi:hypothetical protein